MEPFQTDTSAKGASLFLLRSWMEQRDGLTVGFSGRGGGVSGTPWASLNIGLHVGDSERDVIRNRELLAAAIGWPFDAWTCAEQVHGARVCQVTEAERGRGRLSMADTLPGCDAVMTDVPGVLLTSFYADCVPLYFHDPDNGAVALAHAGWKGTADEIAAATISAMASAYGSRAERLGAAIGPSIGECCYEVDGVVIRRMEAVMHKLALSERAADACMKMGKDDKARLNLKEINRQIMIKAGILPSRIEISKWCTGCRLNLFFSHRMEGGRTGRMASWIGMAER